MEKSFFFVHVPTPLYSSIYNEASCFDLPCPFYRGKEQESGIVGAKKS